MKTKEGGVMDIEKEREAFEQHLTDTGLVEFAGYGFEVDECDEYLHEPTQVAWECWLIGSRRAKAQAVPEGFVVVPKHPTRKMMIASSGWDQPHLIYKAMIEAAQEPTND